MKILAFLTVPFLFVNLLTAQATVIHLDKKSNPNCHVKVSYYQGDDEVGVEKRIHRGDSVEYSLNENENYTVVFNAKKYSINHLRVMSKKTVTLTNVSGAIENLYVHCDVNVSKRLPVVKKVGFKASNPKLTFYTDSIKGKMNEMNQMNEMDQMGTK